MARIIEAEARISAIDATGRVFESIAQKIKPLHQAFKSLRGVSTAGMGTVNRNLSRLQHSIGTLAPVAGSAAAYEGMRGAAGLIHETVKAAAARAHEAARMDVSGMSESEIAEAEQVSARLSERYKALSQTTIMHSLRNMRAIVGTYEEAAAILDPILKLRIAAMGAHPERSEELESDFDQLVKGMEIKGVTMDPEKFRSYMQGMAKAINVFGDTLRPTDYYEMFKYGRQATQNLSEKFMLETAPTLAQELRGSSAGKAMSSFYQAIVGGRIKEQSVKEMQRLGLVNEDRVVRTKTGSIKGLLPGGVKGWQLAASDPYAWTNEVLLPALKKHGIASPQAIQAVIGTIFQQATAAQMVGIFATQQARIQKDWNLVHGAKGLEAAETFQSKDPFIAWSAVTEQFKNLLAAAGGPLAAPAAAGLNAIAAGIVKLEHVATEHPWAAAGGLGAAVTGVGAASLAASLWALRGLGRFFIGSGGKVAQDLSGDAAVKVLQSTLPDLGPSVMGTVASSALRYVGGPLGFLLGSTAPAGAGERPFGKDWYSAPERGYGGGPFAGAPFAAPEVKGSADLNVNVQVEPSDSFISRIVSALRNEINVFGGSSGTAGSTGLSMPEAVPGP